MRIVFYDFFICSVVPVAVAIMTPVPLGIAYSTRRLWWKCVHGKKQYPANKTALVASAPQQGEHLVPKDVQQHI